MHSARKITFASQLIAVLLAGAAIKLFYSTASVNDLLWVLAPTRFLVGLATGVGFTFESYSGYMSSDHSFLIAASCSGVNFLLTAFLMLALSHLWRHRSLNISWNFIPISFGLAYLTTIIANTIRISTAMYIRRKDPELIWLNPEDLHRFEGIVIYFGFLLLLFIVSECGGSGGRQSSKGRARLWRYLLPLAVYYATTIVIPFASGAFRHGPAASEFWRHSLFVLVTPLILVFPPALRGLWKYQRIPRPAPESYNGDAE
jgi:exosortase K